MASYAPLLTNVNEGAYQWTPNLIGYNATSVYGSPSYYAQKMFSNYLGNQVLKTDAVNIPSQLEKLNKQDSIKGVKAEKIPTLFYVVTKNSTTGTVYLKVVNTSNTAQNVLIDLKGVSKVASNGLCTLLKANGPKETNSITEPKNIVPVTTKIKGIKKKFNYAFPAYSISVLQLETSK